MLLCYLSSLQTGCFLPAYWLYLTLIDLYYSLKYFCRLRLAKYGSLAHLAHSSAQVADLVGPVPIGVGHDFSLAKAAAEHNENPLYPAPAVGTVETDS